MSSSLDLLSLFLLGFSSLLPVVNPVGTALIINPYFAGCTLAQRRGYAFRVCLASAALSLAALWIGSWCLKFMGISIPTTQIAGGVVIGRIGLLMLNSQSDTNEVGTAGGGVDSALFYPMAFPLTVGPGCISVLVTLSAHAHDPDLTLTLLHMMILSLSVLAVLVPTFFCFAYSHVVIKRVGSTGSTVLNRLMAFVVFCVGIQMLVSGLGHAFPRLFG